MFLIRSDYGHSYLILDHPAVKDDGRITSRKWVALDDNFVDNLAKDPCSYTGTFKVEELYRVTSLPANHFGASEKKVAADEPQAEARADCGSSLGCDAEYCLCAEDLNAAHPEDWVEAVGSWLVQSYVWALDTAASLAEMPEFGEDQSSRLDALALHMNGILALLATGQ